MNLLATLKELPVFIDLDPAVLQKIADKGEIREFARGDVVVAEGAEFTHFIIVLGGRLLLESDVITAPIGRGETIGGLSLLGLHQSFFHVTVRHDATLLFLPLEAFRAIVADHPSFFMETMKMAAAHLSTIHVREAKRPSRVISIYSAPAGVGKTRLAANLACSLADETGEDTLVLDVVIEKKRLGDLFSFGGELALIELRKVESQGSDIVARKGIDHEGGFKVLRIAIRDGSAGDAQGAAPLLSMLSRDFKNIVVDLPPIMNEAVWKFLQLSDHVVVLSSPEAQHLHQTAGLIQKLPGFAKIVIARGAEDARDRIDEIEKTMGNRVDEFLEEVAAEEILVYRASPNSSYARTVRRLARMFSARAVGLALSAGAAKGMAHIGVIRELEAEGIVPDMIAGASIGALVGSMWAMGRSAATMERIARRIKRSDFFSILDLAFPPSPALLRGSRINDWITRMFGKRRFSELEIPLRVIATDVVSGEGVILDRGSVALAIKASIAIPGILRPVERKNRTLIDGAVAMPVPVAALTEMGISKVIAVCAIPIPASFATAPRGTLRKILSPRQSKIPIVAKVFDYGQEAIPNIFEIIVRANQFMESRIAVETCRNAQVVIRPQPGDLHWLDFDASPQFIQAGAQAAREAMPDIKSLIES